MSVTVLRYLHCDGCNEPWIVDPIAGEDITMQRREARKDGWLVGLPGGRDLCANCRPADDVTNTDD